MKYKEEVCSNCKEGTIHRIFRRFGKTNKTTGAKYLKRTVIWCMRCQKRRIIK